MSEANWLLNFALELVAGGTDECDAISRLLDEAGGNLRALEGAYGRAVALRSDHPDDPVAKRALDLLIKALRRGVVETTRPLAVI
jgi:hypothetical protein